MVDGKDKPIRVSELIELEHDPPRLKAGVRPEGVARPAEEDRQRIVAQYTTQRRRRWRGRRNRTNS